MSFSGSVVCIPAREAVALGPSFGVFSSLSFELKTTSVEGSPECISGRRFLSSACVSAKRSLKSGGEIRVYAHAVGLRHGESAPGLAGAEHGGGDEWKSQIFEDFKDTGGLDGKARVQDEEAVLNARGTDADWSMKARERAVEAIRARGLPVGSVVGDAPKKKKRRRKPKKKPPVEFRMTRAQLERLENSISDADGTEGASLDSDEMPVDMDSPWMKDLGSGEGFGGLSRLGSSWSKVGKSSRDDSDAMANRDTPISVVTPYVGIASVPGIQNRPISSRQKRQEDFDLNRKLVGAANADDVLTIAGKVMGNQMWASGEFPLSSFNISTALHRIAKHMEATSMHKGDRLAFARRKPMARLVSAGVESLGQCSPQSISNITWALSKVGGPSLFWTEMDALAEAAISNIADLEPQHMANVAGAFACMQHSFPRLFDALDERTSTVHREFRPQELAQLLWAFAALNQPATRLMDSLDLEYKEKGVMRTTNGVGNPYNHNFVEIFDDKMVPRQESELDCGSTTTSGQASSGVSMEDYFERSSLSELASFSWSYSVLNQLRRPSFALIWRAILRRGLGTTSRVEDLPNPRLQLSQLHQMKIGLQLEFPDLELSFGEPLESLAREQWDEIKSGSKNTSVAQLDVDRLLASMGQRWVTEYSALDYSVDAALVEKKIGLEIDGPTHFTRNTGIPLGHTVVKRRHLAAAGWTMLSIPYQEWDEQEGEEEQRQYLSSLLRNYL